MDPDAIDELETGGEDHVSHGGVSDPTLLDFSANTNPCRPPGTAKVYEAALAAARSYPPRDAGEFRAAAASSVGCEASAIVPTPGAMAAIRLAIETHVSRGDRVLIPAPSFGEYAREVTLQGARPTFSAPDELLDTDPSPFALAIVCQPNNPTGRLVEPDRLRTFASRCLETETPLLVDEAFLDFTDVPSLAGAPGTVVARSLTKIFGLPGLRMGYAVATGRRSARLRAAKPTWSVSVPALAVGTYCLRQREFVEATRERVRSERSRMADRFAARFDVRRSEAPFLLLATDDPATVDEVLATARDAGIALRDARSFRGLDRHFRVAVRRRAENTRLLEVLDV